jgi:MFS family permease
VLWPLGLAVALSLFGDLTLYAVLVTQLDVVGLSLAAVGIMLGVNRLIRIPGNPVGGLLLDRWGRRRLFMVGMLLGVLTTAGYALLRGFWPFLVARLAWGVAWTLINVGGMTMVLDVSTPANRGRLLGIYNTWILAGLAAGPLVGGFLVDAYGFRPAMLACATITGVGLLIALLALPETNRRGPRTRPAVRSAEPWHRRLGDFWGRRMGVLLRGSQGLVTASALFGVILFAGDGVVLSTLSLLLQRRFGDQVTASAVTMGVASAGGLLLGLRSVLAGMAGPLAGHWSDTRINRWSVIVVSLLVGAAGFGLLAYANTLALMVLGVALSAVSSGAALATLAALVGDLAPAGRQGVVMGAFATAGDVGSTAGPFLAFGLIAVADPSTSSDQALRWVYLLCAVLFLAGLGLIWRGARAAESV